MGSIHRPMATVEKCVRQMIRLEMLSARSFLPFAATGTKPITELF